MHFVDWAAIRLREIDDLLKSVEHALLTGQFTDWTGYQKAAERRRALLEVRLLLTDGLGRDEARF